MQTFELDIYHTFAMITDWLSKTIIVLLIIIKSLGIFHLAQRKIADFNNI